MLARSVSSPTVPALPAREPLERARAERARAIASLIHELRHHVEGEGPRREPIDTDGTHAGRPATFSLLDASGTPRGLALVAGQRALASVARTIEQVDTARLVLGADAGSAVLSPIATGWLDGMSYAIFPHVEPLRVEGLLARIEHLRVAAGAFRFAYDVARLTCARVHDSHLRARVVMPLEHLLRREDVGPTARALARATLARMERGAFRPMRVLAHNAFGRRALVHPKDALAARDSDYGVLVTGWDALDVQGSPCWDVVRLADSLKIPQFWLARELSRHAALLGYGPEDVAASVLIGAAQLGLALGATATQRYAALVQRTVALAMAAGGVPRG